MAEKEIDPRFFLPPNVVDLSYSDVTESSSDFPAQQGGVTIVDPIESGLSPIDEMESQTGGNDDSRLLPPDYITIISQSAKVTSGGTVVDVIIDVEDTPGASQFEVRMTK